MDLLAVSPENGYADEADWIVRLLEAGLSRYHLRKPAWSIDACRRLIDAVPSSLHGRISIHQHHGLAAEYGLGIHDKDRVWAKRTEPSLKATRSCSVHALEDLAARTASCEYVFLSPVFPSLSKPGYAPTWSDHALRAALAVGEGGRVYALGGIDATTAQRALDLGFDGLVLHGCLWSGGDPCAALDAVGKVAA